MPLAKRSRHKTSSGSTFWRTTGLLFLAPSLIITMMSIRVGGNNGLSRIVGKGYGIGKCPAVGFACHQGGTLSQIPRHKKNGISSIGAEYRGISSRSFQPLSASLLSGQPKKNQLPLRWLSHDHSRQAPLQGSSQDTTEAAATKQENGEDSSKKTIDSEWNLKDLVKETLRLALRLTKKIGKANIRYENAMKLVEKLTAEGADPSMQELESCPDVESIEKEMAELRQRLQNLNALEGMLAEVQFNHGKKAKSVVLPEEVASLAIQLEVNDAPPKRVSPAQQRRKRNPPDATGPRKPYRTYVSKDDIEIRVREPN
jgi:hypothetical protein